MFFFFFQTKLQITIYENERIIKITNVPSHKFSFLAYPMRVFVTYFADRKSEAKWPGDKQIKLPRVNR